MAYRSYGKNFIDFVVTMIAFILTFPVFILIYFLIRVRLGGPVFFKQTRAGINGNLFTLYKFRTMKDLRGKDGSLLDDVDRLEGFGRWMRKWSLDELPELYNILKGDMSLVGPRPLLPQYLDRYTPEQVRRHEVKPGLTGWAQINGRNAISWEEKFKLDVWYVGNRSIWLDMKIVAMTVVKVVRGEGISAEGEATMTEFMGGRDRR